MISHTILILYHSGAGSTKTLAEVYFDQLKNHKVSIMTIDNTNFNYEYLLDFDLLILAFPTYHCEPSHSMALFVNNMPVFSRELKAFIFTTYGLYSGNALRIFSKNVFQKNIKVVGYADYKAPATDGVLLFPAIDFMFKYEKKIASNICHDISRIEELLTLENPRLTIPWIKVYTLFNYPNKSLAKLYIPHIKTVKESCIKCNLCVRECPNYCWSEFPSFDSSNCESCYKCIHHCPTNALVLSKLTIQKKKLNSSFYKQLKNNIIEEIINMKESDCPII